MLSFDDLWDEDFVLVASRVGRRQLSRLEISPYQEGLLARGLCHQPWGQVPDGWMEQAMGYAGSIGMMLMDEIISGCERNERRFTEVWTDLGKVEMELGKARTWSGNAQDMIDQLVTDVEGLVTWVRQIDASQQSMRIEMDTMVGNINTLLELNRQMIQGIHQLRAGQIHGQNNLIVIDDEPDDVVDAAPVPVPELVVHTLVPIEELAESEGESSEEEEIWEISCEEFVGSSPEL